MSLPVEADRALLGLVKPASDISKVVLPEPEGPSKVTNSPASTERSIPVKAVTCRGLRQIVDNQ